MRALVPDVSLELSRSRRDDGRARHHPISLDHSAWVQRYVPEFEKRWGRYARHVHSSWRMDETVVSVRGGAHYLYRAVDKYGKTVDSLLCVDRSESAARAVFNKALETHQPRRPRKMNLDGNAASHRTLRLLRQEHPEWPPSWCAVWHENQFSRGAVVRACQLAIMKRFERHVSDEFSCLALEQLIPKIGSTGLASDVPWYVLCRPLCRVERD
jgi:transposase-like protein